MRKKSINEKLTDFCFIPQSQWKFLANLAMKEDWSYKNTESDYEYPILVNYIIYTFKKLYNDYLECKDDTWLLIDENDSICFNTGLLTKNYENIYMLLEKNIEDKKHLYISKGFFKESDNQICIYENLPKRAKFFNKVEDLIFNTELRIVANFEHILEDEENKKRIPKEIRELPTLINILNGEISRVRKRIECNYKVAIPQYYDNKLQFLLPLSLTNNPQQTDLVLAVEKISSNCYKGYTCLTLDMAYNNARQISKPETDWLARNI
ncbi:MAG: DUF3825 domain-containing protein [Clostridia bacterium]|nr:DUF3825 domain-containing protein [Clostridia bacterium]